MDERKDLFFSFLFCLLNNDPRCRPRCCLLPSTVSALRCVRSGAGSWKASPPAGDKPASRGETEQRSCSHCGLLPTRLLMMTSPEMCVDLQSSCKWAAPAESEPRRL